MKLFGDKENVTKFKEELSKLDPEDAGIMRDMLNEIFPLPPKKEPSLMESIFPFLKKED